MKALLYSGILCATGCISSDRTHEDLLARAQEPAKSNRSPVESLPAPQNLATQPSLPPTDNDRAPLPINLAAAFQLAGARPIDVQVAERQVAAAALALDRAKLLWVPNLVLGADYFAHTGPQQSFSGQVVSASRDSLMAGLGPNIIFSFADAFLAPLAARQDLRAREAIVQTAVNDVSYLVADAYFGVQQARGELAGSIIIERQAEELARRASVLAVGLAPPSEENRAKVELARRHQATVAARERWNISGAELARLLRLDQSALIEPIEPPSLSITLIEPDAKLDGLIPLALLNRPELAGSQAIVRATLARLEQEKIRPLVPSLAVRSASTNPSSSIGYGTFGAGLNDSVSNFAGRFDLDFQLLWEFQSLGLGNRVSIRGRKVEVDLATLELFRTQDRIAAEVAQAYAQVISAKDRLSVAEPALKEAMELVSRGLDGLGQTRRVGDAVLLVVRPQEAVAAIQALAQANSDFFAAVGDYNRAQFRLFRALGRPAQSLAGSMPNPPVAEAKIPDGIVPSVEPIKAAE